jgi:hypothetical protein
MTCDSATKPSAGVAGVDELVGLGDVLAHDQLRLHRLLDAERLQGLDGRLAVGRELRVGDGQLVEVAVFSTAGPSLDQIRLGGPEHQGADGIGEARAGDGDALLFQQLAGALVGRQQGLEGAPFLICA